MAGAFANEAVADAEFDLLVVELEPDLPERITRKFRIAPARVARPCRGALRDGRLHWRARSGRVPGEAVPAFVEVAVSTSRFAAHDLPGGNRWQPEP